MNYRQGQVLIDNNQSPDWAAAHRVYITPVGAVASGSLIGGNIQIFVRQGHSFKAGDKALIAPNTVNEIFTDPIDSVTATSLVWDNPSLGYFGNSGDPIVNLASDGGGASPNFDGSPMQCFTAPDPTMVASNAIFSCDEFGNYSYWHLGDGRFWEVILDPDDNVRGLIQGFNTAGRRCNIFDYGLGPATSAPNLVGLDRWDTLMLAVTTDGGELWFPGSVDYPVGDPLLITRSNLRITAGPAARLTNDKPSGQALTFFSMSAGGMADIEFDSLWFYDADPANHGASTCIVLDDTSQARIVNCRSDDVAKFAVLRSLTAALSEVLVANNICTGLLREALTMSGTEQFDNWHILGNYFQGTGEDATNDCIAAASITDKGIVANNIIMGWGTAARYGISVDGSNCVVSGNMIEDNGTILGGINIVGGNNVIMGNNSPAGIVIAGGVGNTPNAVVAGSDNVSVDV